MSAEYYYIPDMTEGNDDQKMAAWQETIPVKIVKFSWISWEKQGIESQVHGHQKTRAKGMLYSIQIAPRTSEDLVGAAAAMEASKKS